MSGQSGAAQGAEYGSVIPGVGNLVGWGIGAGLDSATSQGGPNPLVNSHNMGNPLSDPEAQLRIQQAKAQQMQAKGQAADILTGGAGLNSSGNPTASQVLLGGR